MIHVRMKEAYPALGLRVGEDASLDGPLAKFLKDEGKAWVVGGDPADFAATGLECDADAGPPVYYPPRETTAEVIPAATKEG